MGDVTFEQAQWLRAGGYTRRYHGWRTLLDDPVGLHSYNVVNIALLIEPNLPRQAIIYALRADSAEWEVGDMPAPSKRKEPAVKAACDRLEDQAFKGAGIALPQITPGEKRIIKLADYLDGMMYALQELQMGNKLIIPVWFAFDEYVELLLKDSKPGSVEGKLYVETWRAWIAAGGPRHDGQ